MLMKKEDASPFVSVLWSLTLYFHGQLFSFGWRCLRIESHMLQCSAFWSRRFDFMFVEQVSPMKVA